MEAAQILEAVSAVYEDCQSYEDSGTLTSSVNSEKMREPTLFKTKFVRPDLMLFECARVWRDADGVYNGGFALQATAESTRLLYHNNNEIKVVMSHPDLPTGIAAATGVSDGAIVAAGAFLLSSVRKSHRFNLANSQSIERLSDDMLLDLECFRVRVVWNAGQLVNIYWIAKTDYSIRQILSEAIPEPRDPNDVAMWDAYMELLEGPNRVKHPDKVTDKMSSLQKFSSVTFNNSITIDAFEVSSIITDNALNQLP